MEEIDNIIIHSLRQIGCAIDDNSTLSSLEPSTVVKCVSRCLRCIDPSLKIPETMPTGMAQKYGVTIALAEKCTEIGFRGDIGYQTFLYSNNLAELRRVLMFLIDQLPKDETDNVQTTREVTEQERIDAEIRKSLSISLKLNQKVLPIMDMTSGLEFTIPLDYDPRRSIFSQTDPSNILSTIIITNSEGSSNMRREGSFRTRSVKSKGLRSSASANSVTEDKSNEEPSTDDNIAEEEPQEDPVEQKRILVQSVREKIQQKQGEKLELRQRIEKAKKQFEAQKGTLEELRLQKKIKERTLVVLENPQENIEKLNKMIDNAGEKMKRLQEQWMEHKTPLQQQIDEINARKATEASKTKVFHDQILEVRQKQKVIRSETQAKALLYAQSMEELGKVNQKIDRSAYTSRILEIIGNIRKQKTDIDKILRDTREVQKDINTVTGRLERQFTVTDDLLFGHAKRDEQTKRAYKLFLKAHADCGELAKSIQDTGKISREIRDLEEQIENSRARNTSANLQQVSLDLEEMTEENKKLFQEIQRIRQNGLGN